LINADTVLSAVTGDENEGQDLVRRADRLFDIIQSLRNQAKPITAAALATDLEVTTRTIYRDIATLQARRIPIEGEPGVGYVLRKGYDLPPLMFTSEEIEAIAVGVRLVHRIRDSDLRNAAERVLSKLQTAVPHELQAQLTDPRFYVSEGSTVKPVGVSLFEVRQAIRHCLKMNIDYADENQRSSNRTIWPIATLYYVDVTLVAGWCELRQDFRHFRADRISRSTLLDERFANNSKRLMQQWMAIRASELADHAKLEQQ
jgi:predicted DNA-binding transcriptional regulator YafY